MEYQKRKKLEYKWVVIGVSALVVCIALGFCSSTNSMYIKAITQALGIKRSAFSLNNSFRFVATAIINLFFGTLIARFGAKKLISAGLICLISSCLVYSFATNIFGFYIGGILIGLGFSWTTTTMVGYVVNKWCSENRGTIMGAVLATNGIGAAVATQILSPIINGTTFGYRLSYRLVAIILSVLFVIVMIFFKNKPQDENADKESVPKKKGRGQGWEGVEMSVIVKKKYFYVSLICVFFTGMVLHGINGISAAHMYDVGIDDTYVAAVLSCHALALTAFKFLTGYVYDKRGLRFTANLCMITTVVTFFLLSKVSETETGRICAMVYGIFSSLALPLETIMLPIYASDLFGDKSFSKVLGLFVSVNTAGYAIGSPVSNLCYDITGNYNFALYTSCIIMAFVIIGMNMVMTVANRERKTIENR